LVLALGCGLVAAIGVTQVMSNKDDVVAEDEQIVFVVKDEVGLGYGLTVEELKQEKWPKDKVPVGAVTSFEEIEGRLTRTILPSGSIILDDHLYAKGEGSGDFVHVPDGHRVVAVRVDMVTGVSNMIKPHDRVDLFLFARRDPSLGITATTMRPILQDVKVYAVNDVLQVDKSDPKERNTIKAATVSFVVTPDQALKVSLAAQVGTLQLAPRSPTDNVTAEYTDIDIRDLIGDGPDKIDRTLDTPKADAEADSGLLAMIENQMEEVAQTPPPADLMQPTFQEPEKVTWEIKLVLGSEIRPMELVRNAEPSESGFENWELRESQPDAGFSTATDLFGSPGQPGGENPGEDAGEDDGLPDEDLDEEPTDEDDWDDQGSDEDAGRGAQ